MQLFLSESVLLLKEKDFIEKKYCCVPFTRKRVK